MVVTGMATMGVPTTYQQVITGLFLLVVVGIAIKAKKDEVVKQDMQPGNPTLF